MARFKFRFQPLLNYQRNQLGFRRQVLSQILADERTLTGRLRSTDRRRLAVLDELRIFGKVDKMDVAASVARHQHAEYLQEEIHLIVRELGLVRRQFKLCQQTLLELAQAVKAFEKLRERQQAKFLNARMSREFVDAHERLAAQAFMRSSG